VTRAQARSALIVITLIWGVSITAVKGLLGYAAPLTSVAVRFGLAGLVLVPALRGLKRPELRGGLLIGLVFGLGVMFQNLGLAHTTASRSAFIVALSALLTPALGALILGHKPSGIVVARLLVAMSGVFLLTAPGGSLADLNRGDLLTIVAAVLYAGQIVAVGHYAMGSDTRRLLGIQLLMTSGISLLLSPALETPSFHLVPMSAALVAFLSASSLTTFSLQIRAQRVVTASEAALVYTFEPVVTAATAYLAFGETLGPVQWVGGLVILVAVGWPEKAPKPQRPNAPTATAS
jgi:drug/metabolite transporter (DMT)-like permease